MIIATKRLRYTATAIGMSLFRLCEGEAAKRFNDIERVPSTNSGLSQFTQLKLVAM